MGIGMMNMSTGGVMGGVAQAPWQNTQGSTQIQQQAPVNTNNTNNVNEWVCPNCKATVTGKFCSECGTKKQEELKCSKCNTKLTSNAKFCPECGEKV